MTATKSASPNLCAFLDMLAHSEGTSTVQGSDDGYNVIVGGTLFHSYADHPRVLVHLNAHLESTAAGRYQLLARFFDAYRVQLHLPDFSPASQDAIAVQQIRECRAFDNVIAGRLTLAIDKCAHIWASLPGAGYGQRENKMADLVDFYRLAGGVVAA